MTPPVADGSAPADEGITTTFWLSVLYARSVRSNRSLKPLIWSDNRRSTAVACWLTSITPHAWVIGFSTSNSVLSGFFSYESACFAPKSLNIFPRKADRSIRCNIERDVPSIINHMNRWQANHLTQRVRKRHGKAVILPVLMRDGREAASSG